MKILNQLLIIIACTGADLTVNGVMGAFVCMTTPCIFAYHISFFSPKILRIVSVFFVIMQALLYNITSPFFYATIALMFLSARFFNKLLLEDRWVRWLLTTFYLSVLLLFLICRRSA